jgi:hypothetical protein
MIRPLTIMAFLACFAVMLVSAQAARNNAAPFQIEARRGTLVTVDLGNTFPERSRQSLSVVTFLGPNGSVVAPLLRFRRACESVCGDKSDRHCHWVGEYKVPGNQQAELTTALPGKRQITDIKPLRFEKDPEPLRAADWASGGFQKVLAGYDGSYRWKTDPSTNKTLLELEGQGTSFYNYAPPIELSACTRSNAGRFSKLDCGQEVSLLYDHGRLLAVSLVGFDATANILNALQLDGQPVFSINLGQRYSADYGLLLFNGQNWEVLAEGRHGPLAC